MNELWMNLGCGFLYHQTKASTIKEAMEEFLGHLDKIGCIYDNFGWKALELRCDGDVDNVIEMMGRENLGDLDI